MQSGRQPTGFDADGLLITAGAGMGVDSGLPDFRGQMGSGVPTRRCASMDFRSRTSPIPLDSRAIHV